MDRSPVADPDDPLVGRLLDGRYLIGERIDRGGMATVYQALDQRLERTVAVKVMHPGLGDDEEFAARFVREARHAARLSHPNVVAVHDQGRENGTVFLVMEYVPGHTLRDVIRAEAPLPPRKALALAEPIVAALAAAHEAGLIHRDVKPENVLISDRPDGAKVKVADFGLAKAISADTQHTATGGVLIGTVSYLAPELVVDGRADTRADVYALGVVLFELLTGKRPHEGESPIQVAYKHVHEDVPPPSSLVDGVPDYVDALVARATARDREHRSADARVLLRQLRRVQTALAAGTASDPDLVADLAPPRAAADPDPDGSRHDTARDPFVDAPPVVPTPASETTPRTPPPDADLTSAFAVEHLAHLASPGVAPSRPGPGPATNPRTDPVRAGRPGGVGPGAPAVPLPPAGAPRRRRGPWIWLVGALVLALLAGFGYWFGIARWTSTPAVLEYTQADAQQRIEDAGLTFELGDPEYSNDVAEGLVLRTDPGPGDRVLDGGTVTVILSLGEELYPIPTVADLSEDDAQAALTEHFQYDETKEIWSESVPAGTAIRVEVNGRTVEAGEQKPPSTRVTLVVSKGRKPIPVKDFTGKQLTQLQAYASKRKLQLDTEEVYDDTVKKGLVVSQNPTSGTLYRGESITVKVSKGPELVTVPSTRAKGVRAATDMLEDLGFKVKTRPHPNGVGFGIVTSSDPPSGARVPKGSTITLIVF
ncbi:Stk1 family PASTA domain-containing Ser/Thr kinase [Nocardioides daejeonensis]|uniref:Stk1 family PASTA domain-containing Ser/Thr kinase n=1 Tax=Nocardioides daejeonensis TaxID=1046556 RepID=UPI0013A57AF4|nr:Stk1 family PASTA domain-containing Ser/Thr kinase [Nocardioides daejeonensis]